MDGSDEWLQECIDAAAYVDSEDVSAEAVDFVTGMLPTLPRSMRHIDANTWFLADPAVQYATAAKLFAAIKPASAAETAAFLCRPDVPGEDAARVVASERRMSSLAKVAALTGREPAVYEAVVSLLGETTKTSDRVVFAVLSALLTNPDVPLAVKAAAAAVPSADAWQKLFKTSTSAWLCWQELKTSEQLQKAAFAGLRLPDSMLLDCASWQCLTLDQLRTVFAGLQRQAACSRTSALHASGGLTDYGDRHRLPGDLVMVCDHSAADDELLSEVDAWFDEGMFDPEDGQSEPFFQFAYRKHRRQNHRVDPTEFWAAHPTGDPEKFELFEWSYWTRIPSVTALVDVLAENLDGWRGIVNFGDWLVLPLMPLMSSVSAAELLAGLDAAVAADMPDLPAVVEDLYWQAAPYEALTPDVLRRLRPPQHPSSVASVRLLELLAATLGPDLERWQVFEQVSAPAATVGDILELTVELIVS